MWLQYQKMVYINNLDNIVNEYNNIFCITIKMEPAKLKIKYVYCLWFRKY